MIFSPFYFILFLILVLSIYFIVPVKLRCGWLLLTSYIFCLSYQFNSLIMLVCTTFISYLLGIGIDKLCNKKEKKLAAAICLWCGIATCMLPLVIGKTSRYSLFMVIGISFYALQEISYLTDIYKRKSRAEKNLIQYALFIAFFPKLVSGPIERSENLLKQIAEKEKQGFHYERAKSGFLLMLWGYFQKSIVADSFAGYVGSVYEQWEAYSGITLVLATVLFAFQLYADFVGYTNIAVGAAQVLGFQLQQNFKQPYLADSVKDFWRRWHISLSSWLRDYIYIPLGGNRKGKVQKYLNLMITFLVSGLWHGTSWNFIAWGMLHGGYQVAGECWKKVKKRLGMSEKSRKTPALQKVIQSVFVFILVDIAWIFFRASGLKSAVGIVKKCLFDFSAGNLAGDIFSSLNLSIGEIALGIGFIVILIVVDVLHERGISIRKLVDSQPVIVRWFCYLGVMLLLTFTGMRRYGAEASNFIYMQF